MLNHGADNPKSAPSAAAVLPFLIATFRPASIVDIGCGMGTWLREASRLGVTDIHGIDTEESAEALVIPRTNFRTSDLTEPVTFDRRFDMCLSLEVAEHLPESAAECFVSTLVKASPIVVFSAAIPGQGGPGHINEQWPDYWRSAFAAHGYSAFDLLRERFWTDERVAWYYAQNMILYLESDKLLSGSPSAYVESRIHPRIASRYRFQQRPAIYKSAVAAYQWLRRRVPTIAKGHR